MRATKRKVGNIEEQEREREIDGQQWCTALSTVYYVPENKSYSVIPTFDPKIEAKFEGNLDKNC